MYVECWGTLRQLDRVNTMIVEAAVVVFGKELAVVSTALELADTALEVAVAVTSCITQRAHTASLLIRDQSVRTIVDPAVTFTC